MRLAHMADGRLTMSGTKSNTRSVCTAYAIKRHQITAYSQWTVIMCVLLSLSTCARQHRVPSMLCVLPGDQVTRSSPSSAVRCVQWSLLHSSPQWCSNIEANTHTITPLYTTYRQTIMQHLIDLLFFCCFMLSMNASNMSWKTSDNAAHERTRRKSHTTRIQSQHLSTGEAIRIHACRIWAQFLCCCCLSCSPLL